MADIRIKDLATTASSAASDDFMAVDGATNGTRKMSAANPSVTTLTTSGVIAPGGSVHGANGSAANPSFAFLSNQNTGLYRIGLDNLGVAANGAKVLDIATTGLTVTGALGASSLTSPAASPLTLGTGTSGAAITVLSANNFVGIGTTTPAQKLQVGSTTDATSNFIRIATDSSRSQGISFLRSGSIETVLAVVSQKLQYAINPASNSDADLVAASKFTIDNAGITTIANSTAGSAGAGALVVTGGLATGAASYLGGAVSVVTGNGTGAQTSKIQGGSSGGDYGILNFQNGATVRGRIVADASATSFRFDTNGTTNTIDFLTGTGYTTALSISGTTQAATFAGAVAIGNTVAVGVAVASTQKVTMVIGGVTYYLLASNV
jgi:hypothetical protein